MSLFDCNIGYSLMVRDAYLAAIQRLVDPVITIVNDGDKRRSIVTTWTHNQFMIRNIQSQRLEDVYASDNPLAFLIEKPIDQVWVDSYSDTYLSLEDSDCGQCAACGSLTSQTIARSMHNMSVLNQSDDDDYDEQRIYPAERMFQSVEAQLLELWLNEPGPLGDLTRQLYGDSDG
jgi:hypothetical protein